MSSNYLLFVILVPKFVGIGEIRMIYILYGPDTYRSRQKLKSIVEEFRKKTSGSLGFEIFDAEEDDSEKIIPAANSPSLFREKKLIVIERLLASKNELAIKIQPYLKSWGESRNDIFIFWDEEAKDAKKLDELLNIADKSQEFKLLDQTKTRIFIEKEAQERKLRLSEKEKIALMSRHRNNLWGIVNELDKIALGGDPSPEPMLNKEEKIYNFLDALSLKQKSALRLLLSLYENGFNDIYILASLVNHFRNLLLIKKASLRKDGLGKLEKLLNLYPIVWKKSMAQASRFNDGELEKIFGGLLKYDILIKLGKIKLENAVFEIMYS